ncbi:hypothetical protein EV193_105374 [Herbihabitans rhizosphaerae]|uniref:Uncharacterized protein n=1 Tax=Herbihabitans rhizosphaerae TaxID=1872711 RepID=A0A4Q7KMV8_9PSEU|nr:hypothetical protein [Herbihabitans rhizosphaerae]RZS37815.1 hypothetical protein EV193_105374 [Herbihabitans rhizosphaerae]
MTDTIAVVLALAVEILVALAFFARYARKSLIMSPSVDPPETVDLLLWFTRHGFTTYYPGGANRPNVIVLSRINGAFIDVAHVRGADRAEAARIPNDDKADIWHPRFVVWHFYGGSVESLTALRNLATPDARDASGLLYEPPREDQYGFPHPLIVTRAERKEMTVRPPIQHII